VLKYKCAKNVEINRGVDRFKSCGSSAVNESRFGRLSILACRFVQIKRGFLIGSSGITDR
jgi:hypothetical protein